MRGQLSERDACDAHCHRGVGITIRRLERRLLRNRALYDRRKQLADGGRHIQRFVARPAEARPEVKSTPERDLHVQRRRSERRWAITDECLRDRAKLIESLRARERETRLRM